MGTYLFPPITIYLSGRRTRCILTKLSCNRLFLTLDLICDIVAHGEESLVGPDNTRALLAPLSQNVLL